MKIAILGATGMLGYAATKYFEKEKYEVYAFARSDFDIAKEAPEQLERLFKKAKIEIVLNCSGIIKPMISKTTIENVVRVNSIFPRNLGLICKAMDLPCIHITTDCVYSGQKGNYTESDYFDAEDLYGMSKNAGEIGDLMVLRTSIIGEEKGQSRSLLEWARSQKGKSISGYTDHLWNGVTTHYLSEIIGRILKERKYERGIFHLHSPTDITKYDLLKSINQVYKLDININAVVAPERCNRTLRSQKSLTKELAIKEISNQIQDMYNFFREG